MQQKSIFSFSKQDFEQRSPAAALFAHVERDLRKPATPLPPQVITFLKRKKKKSFHKAKLLTTGIEYKTPISETATHDVLFGSTHGL